MKHLLLTILCAALAASCTKDDRSLQDAIIGTWEFQTISAEVETDDPELTASLLSSLSSTSDYIRGDKRRQDIISQSSIRYMDVIDGRWYTMPYAWVNGKLRIYFDGGPEYDEATVSINGSTLKLRFDVTAEQQVYYPKVKIKKAVSQFVYRRIE